ncbi:MAG: autotransporter outer membrane beta-barrel domain-containing protein [Duodenibacillus massiliensis]
MTAAQKDAVDLTRNATDARVRETRLFTRHDGGSVWLDLNGASSESKAMGDDAGYKSRLGALHLGADIKTGTTPSGVAYSYGRGDIDTTGLTKNLDGVARNFSACGFTAKRPGGLSACEGL